MKKLLGALRATVTLCLIGAGLLSTIPTALAQTGIGTVTPDRDKALHVKAQAGQEPIRLEGIAEGTTEDTVVVTGIDGVLRYRPIQDLTISGEWRDSTVAGNDLIYAAQARKAGNDVVVTDIGAVGIGTATPRSPLHVATHGLLLGNDIDGLYDAREAIRFSGGGESDAIITTQDGAGRFNFKWNASYGGTESFLTTGDYAVRMSLHGDPAPLADVFSVFSSSAAGTAGSQIGWVSRFTVQNDGNVGVSRSNPESTLDVGGTVRVRTLPDGIINGADPTDDYVVLADRATNELRKISPSALFDDEGEWIDEEGGLNADRIYARRARAAGSEVSFDEAGRLGLGVRAPVEKIHLRGGGMRIDGQTYGIGFNNETPYSALPTRDGSRIYHEGNTLGSWRDVLVIEKTDFNHAAVDGGIVFANRQNGNNRYISMSIRGDGNVGIGRNHIAPRQRLHVLGKALFQEGGAADATAASAGIVRIVDDVNLPGGFERGVQVADDGEYAYFGLEDNSVGDDAMVMWGNGAAQDLHFVNRNGGTDREIAVMDGQFLNVGIGTTPEQSASVKLDVGGRVRVRDLDPQTGYDENNDLIVIADAQGHLQTVTADVFRQDFEDLDWTISGDDIYNANARAVGIGVTGGFGATYKLDIGAATRVRGANRIYFRDGTTSIYSSNAQDLDIQGRDKTTFRRFGGTSLTPHPLVIDHDGRSVGIGVNDPGDAYALEVVGISRLRDQSELRFGGDDDNMLYAAGNTDFRLSAQQLFSVRSRGDGTGVLSVRTDQRRVGIGLNNPAVGFDVNTRTRLRDLPNGNEATDWFVTANGAGDLRRVQLSDFEGPWANVPGTPGRTYLRTANDRVGIGTANPQTTFHLYEAVGTARSAARGSMTIEHGDAGGESSIVFKSRRDGSDYGYISYADDASGNGSSNQNGLLRLGVENEGEGNSRQDDLALMASGNVGVGTTAPKNDLHVAGGVRVDDLPTVNNATDFAVTADANGDLRRQAIANIRDNLGNHQMQQDLATNGHAISYNGTDAGIKLTPQNSVMTSNRLQIGNIIPYWLDDAIGGQTNGFAGNDGVIFAPVRADGTENSDMRVYILDNNNDRFSFWGNPCGGGNCGSIDAASRVFDIRADGQITIDKLGTSGADQMVTVDANGVLGSAAIPTAGGGSTADNLGNHRAEQNIRLQNYWLTNDGGNRDGLRVSDDGTVFFNTSRVLAWSNNNLWDVYSTSITGDTDTDGGGGNNDLRLRGRDDVFMRSNGGDGDIVLNSDDDVFIRADDDVNFRIDGNANGNDFTFTANGTNRNLMRIRNNGEVRVDNLAGAGNRIVTAAPDGTLEFMSGSSTGLWTRDGANAETYLANGGDEVGIGTTDPEDRLHIVADDAAGPVGITVANMSTNGSSALNFREGVSSSAGMRLRYDGGPNKLFVEQYDGAGPYATFERGKGDVGIGTDDPFVQLHVVRNTANGTAAAGLNNPARIRIQNQADQGSSALEFAEGAGGLNNNTGMSLRYHSAADGSANALEVVRGAAENAASDVHLRIERNGGQVTVGDLATGGAAEIVTADANGVLATRAFDASLWAVDNTDSEIFLDPAISGYRLGLGTAAPTAKLDVDGTARVRSLNAGAATDFVVTADANGNLRRRPAGDFDNYWERDPAGNGTNAYTFTATSDDFVGIGTATPTAKLDVDGDLRIRDVAAGAFGTDAILVLDGATNEVRQIPAASFDDFWDRFDAGSQDYVQLSTASDFVGIGTTTAPTAQLHTTGSVRFAGLTSGGSGEYVVADADGNLSTVPVPAQLWQRDVANNYTYTAFGSDNVGIGTSAPTTRFHVASGAVTISDITSNTGDENADRVVVATATGELRSLPAGTLNSPFVKNSNNHIQQREQALSVGLGIATPEAKLHVYEDAAGESVEVQVHNRSGNGSSQIRFREWFGNMETNSMLLRYNGNRNRFEITNGWGDATGTVRTDSFATHMTVMRGNGNVGINTGNANPTQRLHVVGNGRFDGNVMLDDGHRIQFAENNTRIEDNGDDLRVRAQDEIVFGSGNATERMRLHTDGRLQILNNPAGYDLDVSGGTIMRGEVRATGLGGGGTQMVVADNAGRLNVQAIPTFVDTDTDDQTLTWSPGTTTLSIDNGNSVNLADLLDDTDEQALTLAGDLLGITGNASTVDLAPYRDNTDEQAISLSADILRITGNTSVVNLSGYLDNTDEQQLGLSGNVLTLTDGGSVVLPTGSDSQDLTYAAGVLSLTGDATPVDLSNATEIDDQQLTLNAGVLSLTNGGSVTLPTGSDSQALTLAGDLLGISGNASTVDLSAYLDDTDDQQLALSGNTLSLTDGGSVTLPADSDNQSLTLAGNLLGITGSAATINLKPFLDDTDDQTLTLSGTQLSIDNGNSVDLAAIGAGGTWDHVATQNIQLGSYYLSGDGDAEGVFVDAAGNVGIGTTLPSARLHVNGDIAIAQNRRIRFADANSYIADNGATVEVSGNANVSFRTGGQDRGGFTIGGNFRLASLAGGGTPQMVVADNFGFLSTQAVPAPADIWTRAGTTVSLTNNGDDVDVRSDDFVIASSNASGARPVARFDGVNQRAGIGDVTAPTAALHVKPAVAGGSAMRIQDLNNAPVSNNYRRMLIHQFSGEVLRSNQVVDHNGNDLVTSDERLKRDVAPLTEVLDAIAGLRAVSYRYKDEAETGTDFGLDDATHYGVIAQELRAAFPHAVREVGGYLHVDDEELAGILLGAVKELAARNAELEARNDFLDEQMHHVVMEKAELERAVDNLEAQTAELNTDMAEVMRYIAQQRTSTADGGSGANE